jgi:hypothetical protein
MMRGTIPYLLGAALLLGTTAADAKPLPCSSVSAEVRDYVRSRGACRDIKPAPPRAAKRPKAKTTDDPASSPPKIPLPDVVGTRYADAVGTLAKFIVERVDTPGAAPAGEVLSQEPVPTASSPAGSTIVLKVSDGSLANAQRATVVAAAATAPAPTADPAPLQEPAESPEASGHFSLSFSANAVLIFSAGVSLGLLFGGLSMRQWLRRRQPAAGGNAASAASPKHQQSVSPEAHSVAEPAGTQTNIRFAARLLPVETTIALASDGGEAPVELPSEHHA